MKSPAIIDWEVRRLIDDVDQNVSMIALTIHHQMLLCRKSPNREFSRTYFIQSVIRLWFEQRPAITIQSIMYPYRCPPIKATNWPIDLQSTMGRSLMVDRFVELLIAESNPSGNDFDMSYAIEILDSSFDAEGNLRNPPSLTEVEELDFDYWLSGFNSEQP